MTELGFPFTNAVLTAVTAPGAPEDYDQDATAGVSRWAGTVDIIVDDSHQTITTPGRLDEIEQTRLEIPWRVGGLVQLGDTLTFVYRGVTETGVADSLVGEEMLNRRRVLLRDR